MSHPINEPTGVEIRHPDWCDPTLCTVTPAADALEGHCGQPVTVTTTHGLPRKLTVTASLYQPAMYPLAGPFFALEVRGLDADHQEVGGTTLIPAEDAGRLGSVLLDMATAAGVAGGQWTSGTPQAVIREHEDVIDIVGRGTWVPLTFAEARDIEDELCAILAIFDPQPGDRRENEFLQAILATEYPDHQPDQTAGGDQ